MTAPAASAESVLRRADANWCREAADDPMESGRMRMLINAVQALLDSRQADTAPIARSAELDQLRAENAELRRERDHEHNEALRAIGALEVARRERDNYAEQLQQRAKDNVELLRQAETWESEYERVRDEKLVELADEAEARHHRHAWEWQPGLNRMPLPRSCGAPWPAPRPPELAAAVTAQQPKGPTR